MMCLRRLTEPVADSSHRKGCSGGIVSPIQGKLIRKISQLPPWWQSIDLVQVLQNQSDFHQGLKDLNEEMRRLLSDMVALQDHVKIDSLRMSVIETMKAILEASQYILDYLEENKFGEYD